VEGFPEKAAFDVARDLGVAVTTHAGVYNVTSDVGINQMYDGGYMTPGTIYVHAATLSPDSYHKIAATGGYASISTESECNAGQGYSPTWKLRKYGIPVSLSNDTSVWWSADMFAAMRATLNADRAMEHFEAHAKGVGLTNHILRAEDVVDYATRGGAKALGLDSVIGSVEAGKKADIVLIKNDNSPVSFPVLHPYGHVVYQAQRGDVHTVIINGKVVKLGHKLVGVDLATARQAIGATIEYLRAEHGAEEWEKGMHPEIPEHEVLANPYTYREDVSAWKEAE
jgi:5-methylthioadenosine/S-adenosylhomocysteine deaminase